MPARARNFCLHQLQKLRDSQTELVLTKDKAVQVPLQSAV